MDDINIEIKIMKKQLEFIEECLKNMPTIEGMKLANKELIEEIFTSADKKYASKVTEKLIYGLVGAVLLAVVGSITTLILI